MESAKRELKEETGLVAEEWMKLMDFELSNSVTDEKGVIFIARKLSMGSASPKETEDIQIKKIPFEEAYQMVVKGEITDGVAVMGILRIKLLLLEGKLTK